MFKRILVAVVLIGMVCGACYLEHNYTRKNCEVVQVNDGWVTFKDKTGFYWDWEDKNREFEVGDFADLKMYDNCSSAYNGDDVIKNVVRAE